MYNGKLKIKPTHFYNVEMSLTPLSRLIFINIYQIDINEGIAETRYCPLVFPQITERIALENERRYREGLESMKSSDTTKLKHF